MTQHSESAPKSKKKRDIMVLLVILLFAFIGGIASSLLLLIAFEPVKGTTTAHIAFVESEDEAPIQPETSPSVAEQLPPTEELISAMDGDTLQAVSFSPKAELTMLRSEEKKSSSATRKVINIAVIGVDSRIGERSKRADANHLVSIDTESGQIKIFSVPRDTYAEAGFEEDSLLRFNILANSYASGRKHYLKQLARITGVGSIHYYAEIGFSQAMGLIELLGYNDAKKTLRVLRSRKALGGDDYQRSYNQGQFIRQAILRYFGHLDGVVGSALLRSALLLVETNLSYEQARDIYTSLAEGGFPQQPSSVTVALRPSVGARLVEVDFSSARVIDSLHGQVEKAAQREQRLIAKKSGESSTTLLTTNKGSDIQNRLHKLVRKAQADSTKPKAVISLLKTPFEQRAWLQIQDSTARFALRSWIGYLLSSAYKQTKNTTDATHVLEVLAAEEEAFLLARKNGISVKPPVYKETQKSAAQPQPSASETTISEPEEKETEILSEKEI